MPAHMSAEAAPSPLPGVPGIRVTSLLVPSGLVTLDCSSARNDKRGSLVRQLQLWFKRALDITLASLALAVLLPFLLLIAVVIRIESDGPALYRQARRGRFGKPFPVYKFRSMSTDADAPFHQASVADPRVTRVGAILRRSSIDELPQLLNVLDGTMSLIGPRPHPIDLDNAFLHHVPDLMARYEMKPGISGLAQVTGHRGETRDAEAMRARVSQDLRYIERWSPALDIRIIALTFMRLWRDKDAY